jgi:hypothetical protein
MPAITPPAPKGLTEMVAVWAIAETSQSGSCGLQQFANAPHVVSDPRSHCRGDSQRLVDAAEVVECERAGDGGPVVLPLFTEAVGQPCEPAEAHPYGQVLPLHDRCADAFRIGLTHDWDYLDGSNLGGRVPRFAFACCAVDLDELREAGQPIMQRARDRGSVRREAVRGDLEGRVRRCVPDALHEDVGGRLVPLAKRDVENQLGVPLNRYERVGIAEVLIVVRPHALLLLAYEGPKLVALHVAHLDVADLRGHDPLTLLTGQDQELQDRGVVDAGNALDGGNAIAFEHERENHLGFLYGQVHAVQRVRARLGECLRTLAAAKALEPVAMLTEALAFGAAIVAGHKDLDLSSGQVQNEGGNHSLSFGSGQRLNPVGSFNYLRGFAFVAQPKRAAKSLLLGWLVFVHDFFNERFLQ